ncbi:MAG: winged helix-turn-helix transcriptional regulator [Micromonosporaceae bacterium]|nr:winged helix-turn-helix transcriptional regulator [Micromonosporaceae bacterium]
MPSTEPVPPEESLHVSAPEQFKALAHPLRHRLLFALGQQPATIGQLAIALGSQKGTIAHHLKVLREAGMVRIVETRQVRGGTEQYYQRTARRFDFAGEALATQTPVLLQAVAQELASAEDEPFLVLRNIRLSQPQVESLTAALTDLSEKLDDAGPGERRYGLLVGLYRPRQTDPRHDTV